MQLQITLNVLPVNDLPTSDDVSVTTPEDTIVPIQLSGSDVDGTIVMFEITNPSSDGTLYFDAALTSPVLANSPYPPTAGESLDLYFLPNQDFNGTTTVEYRTQDDSGDWDATPATATIQVTPVNDAPTATNDSYTFDEGSTNSISAATGVINNDSDVEGDLLSANLLSGPTHGTLNLQADGSFTYTHDGSETTVDTFTYQISDPSGANDTATVTINITPINDAPIASDEFLTVAEGGTVSLTAPGVLANETDAEGDALSATMISGPSNGIAFIQSDGSLIYMHDGGETTSDSIVYQVDDGNGGITTATVQITVTPVDDVPVANDDAFTVNEGGTHTDAVGVLANDVDDDGDPLTATLLAGPTHGVVSFNSDGTFSYTHDGGESSNDSFSYSVSDPGGNISTATVNISIVAINDAPQVVVPGTQTVVEDTRLTFTTTNGNSISFLDADSQNAEVAVTISSTNGTISLGQTSGLTFVTGTGNNDTLMRFTGTLANINAATDRLEYLPNANYVGQAAIVVQIDDQGNSGAGGNLIEQQIVNIDVLEANDPPVAVGDSFTIDEDQVLTGTVTANDSDIDGDALTALVVSDASNGSVTLNPNGSFAYQPNVNFNGTDSFQYRVSDGISNSNTVTVDLSVTPINDAPDGGTDNYATSNLETLIVGGLGVLANDIDADGDPVSAVIISQPASGLVTFSADGTFIYQPSGSFFGNTSFTYMATDGSSMSSPVTVNITVTPFAVLPPNGPGDGSDPTDYGDNDPTDTDMDDNNDNNEGNNSDEIVRILPPAITIEGTQNEGSTVWERRQTNLVEYDEINEQGQASVAYREAAEGKETEAAQQNVDYGRAGRQPTISIFEIQRGNEYVPVPIAYVDVADLFGKLDALSEQIEESGNMLADLVAGSSLVATTSLTAGYILWMIRGGYLIAMLSSTLPTWSTIDPLPVLSAAGWSAKRKQDRNDKSLTDLVSG